MPAGEPEAVGEPLEAARTVAALFPAPRPAIRQFYDAVVASLHGPGLPRSFLRRLAAQHELAPDISQHPARTTPFWPEDLVFGDDNGRAFTPRHARPVVEASDRCGVLDILLDRLSAASDRATAILAADGHITRLLAGPRSTPALHAPEG